MQWAHTCIHAHTQTSDASIIDTPLKLVSRYNLSLADASDLFIIIK